MEKAPSTACVRAPGDWPPGDAFTFQALWGGVSVAMVIPGLTRISDPKPCSVNYKTNQKRMTRAHEQSVYRGVCCPSTINVDGAFTSGPSWAHSCFPFDPQ